MLDKNLRRHNRTSCASSILIKILVEKFRDKKKDSVAQILHSRGRVKWDLEPPSGTVLNPPPHPPLPQNTVMYVIALSFCFYIINARFAKNAILVNILLTLSIIVNE